MDSATELPEADGTCALRADRDRLGDYIMMIR